MTTSGAPGAIGVCGRAARITVGALLVGSVLYGHAARGWHPVAWLTGLLRRDDRVGCAMFGAIDAREARRRSDGAPAVGVGHGG